LHSLEPACTLEMFSEMQNHIKQVYIHDDIYKYIISLAEETRTHEAIALGISTRGALALAKLCASFCTIKGRDFVKPDDVLYLLPYVFTHRIILKGGLRGRTSAVETILDEIIKSVAVPSENWSKET